MILEQFLNKKAKGINNPISNWGVGFTAEVINEWIELQGLVKPGVVSRLSKLNRYDCDTDFDEEEETCNLTIQQLKTGRFVKWSDIQDLLNDH